MGGWVDGWKTGLGFAYSNQKMTLKPENPKIHSTKCIVCNSLRDINHKKINGPEVYL